MKRKLNALSRIIFKTSPSKSENMLHIVLRINRIEKNKECDIFRGLFAEYSSIFNKINNRNHDQTRHLIYKVVCVIYIKFEINFTFFKQKKKEIFKLKIFKKKKPPK